MKNAAGLRSRANAPGKEQGDNLVMKAKRGGAGARAQTSVGKKGGGGRAREGRWREEKVVMRLGCEQEAKHRLRLRWRAYARAWPLVRLQRSCSAVQGTFAPYRRLIARWSAAQVP